MTTDKTDAPDSPAVRFHLRPLADVSTLFVEGSDLPRLQADGCPTRVGKDDAGSWTLHQVPGVGHRAGGRVERDFAELVKALVECRRWGLSERFCVLLFALWEQGVPYLRLDADGWPVEGMTQAGDETGGG